MMADIMRMRRLLMRITSVWVKNSTKFIRMFMGQYLKGNNMAPIKSIMGDVMRMRKFLNLVTSV